MTSSPQPSSETDFLQETQSEIENIELIKTSSPQCQDLSDDRYYDMRKEGLAIIFNHFKFDSNDEGTRLGTEKDKERLIPCLENLNFKVETYDDPTLQKIEKVIQKVAKLKRSDISCLIIVVMTHGEPDKLHAFDTTYAVETLWDDLKGNKCAGLVGVPKLYFIQRERTDSGSIVTDIIHSSQSPMMPIAMPSMADFLQMYSTYEDHYSFRNKESGGWFIQSLCEVFEKDAKKYDLLQLLTFVNRQVAHRTTESDNPKLNKKKQIPQIVSELTKLLKFNPKI